MNRKQKIMVLIGVDTLIIAFANIISYLYIHSFVPMSRRFVLYSFVIQFALYTIFALVLQVHKRINRYSGFNAILSLGTAITLTSVIEIIIFSIFQYKRANMLHLFSAYFISILLLVASRVVWRVIAESGLHKWRVSREKKKALIIGAGDGGELLYNTLKKNSSQGNLDVVGFIDDDPNKLNMLLQGIKVIGTIDDIPKLVNRYEIEVITVAIPSMTPKEYERLLDIVNPLDITLNKIPSLEELATGKVAVSKLSDIDVVDLLGRDEVSLDLDVIKDQVTNETVLVTGAGGSIGSEICRQVMQFSPKCIVLLGHGENSIYLIEKELRQTFGNSETKIVPVIADVQDYERINEVVAKYKPVVIYHAAAHKHVPLMEYNPREAVKNNIYGTKNVAYAALQNEVQSFVMISTDKAVNPPNVMGATKRISEMIVTGLNKEGKTKFSAVRFRNVLGSRGSVVPLFKNQIAQGGPVTVTDFRMTRYFMTIPEASRLVIQSGALAKGGEIFILDMGEPVKILDLARQMVKLCGYTETEIPIIETGIRPGEKLYEELLVDKERAKEQVHEKIFVGTVNGFQFDEVMAEVEKLPKDDDELMKELIRFAKASSQE